MLDKERIKELTEMVAKGKEADEILTTQKYLNSKIESLESILDICNNCYKITFNNGYANVLVDIEKSKEAAELVRQIIKNEITNINNKLEKLI